MLECFYEVTAFQDEACDFYLVLCFFELIFMTIIDEVYDFRGNQS